MQQILIELDESTLKQLEEVAPSRKRQRSEFIRAAIRRALDELAEKRIEEGYRRNPDDPKAVYYDATEWEPPAKRPARRRH